MRRSKAPSALKKAKRLCGSNNSVEDGHCSDTEKEQYSWGSRNSNLDQHQRIFNVVWRDISARKHKIWKGDGTLEVSNDFLKATLRDETRKYMGCSTKFNRNELVDGCQMLIGGKEIEIQNEILGEGQLHELRERQIENRNWFKEEWTSAKDMFEEKKKPKGGFKFTPILVLNRSKVTSEVKENFNKDQCLNSNWICKETRKLTSYLQTTKTNNESKFCLSNTNPKAQTLNVETCREFICFLKPSELQQFLFQKVLEYRFSIKSALSLDKTVSLGIEQALKLICNHPSLINHKTTTNKVIRHLIHALPEWTEMSPFDSVKLEFVQYFLTDLSRFNPKTCIIFAKNSVVLNMLQGLCDFMNIKCLQLNKNLLEGIESQIIEFFSADNGSKKVLLLKSVDILRKFNVFAYCKKIIFFEEVSKNINFSEQDVIIYNLVTAFSIEELLLLDTYNTDNMENLLDELVNVTNAENDSCYLHSKIGCNCLKEGADEVINPNNVFLTNWKHFKNPFDVELLKISALENSSENIVSIFCKKF